MLGKERAGHEPKLKSFLDTPGRPTDPEVGQHQCGQVLCQLHQVASEKTAFFSSPDPLVSHFSLCFRLFSLSLLPHYMFPQLLFLSCFGSTYKYAFLVY